MLGLSLVLQVARHKRITLPRMIDNIRVALNELDNVEEDGFDLLRGLYPFLPRFCLRVLEDFYDLREVAEKSLTSLGKEKIGQVLPLDQRVQ